MSTQDADRALYFVFYGDGQCDGTNSTSLKEVREDMPDDDVVAHIAFTPDPKEDVGFEILVGLQGHGSPRYHQQERARTGPRHGLPCRCGAWGQPQNWRKRARGAQSVGQGPGVTAWAHVGSGMRRRCPGFFFPQLSLDLIIDFDTIVTK